MLLIIYIKVKVIYFFGNPFLMNMQYGAMFQRLDARSVSSPVQGANFLASSAMSPTLSENSSSDSHISASRPLAYDTDQRYSRLQRDGLVSRRDKSLTHLHEDSQLRRNMSSSGVESLGFGKKWNGVDTEEDCKVCHSESSEKALATKVAFGLTYTQPSSEDEDVCPTCLDGNLSMLMLHYLYNHNNRLEFLKLKVNFCKSFITYIKMLNYFLQNILQKILKSQPDALTISTLAVSMNGWKGVKVVQFVARYAWIVLLVLKYMDRVSL